MKSPEVWYPKKQKNFAGALQTCFFLVLFWGGKKNQKDRHTRRNIHSIRLIFFFLRKISPELTSDANPPLFAKEDWPWANIHAHLPPPYMWDTYHGMARQTVPCPHPGSEPANLRPPKQNVCTQQLCHLAGPYLSPLVSYVIKTPNQKYYSSLKMHVRYIIWIF